MTRLIPEARDIVVSGRRGDGLSTAARARIRGKLARRLGAGFAVGTVASAGTLAAEAANATTFGAGAGALFAGSLTAKLLGVAALALAIGAGVVGISRVTLQHESRAVAGSRTAQVIAQRSRPLAPVTSVGARSSTRSVPARTDASSVVSDFGTTSIVVLSSASAARTEPPPTRRRASAEVSVPDPLKSDRTASTDVTAESAPPEPSGATRGELDRQVAELRQARAAIRAGDGAAALDAIDRAIPSGQASPLEEESTYARILALCQLGRVTEARQQAEHFLAHFPQSPLSARVRTTCGLGYGRFSD